MNSAQIWTALGLLLVVAGIGCSSRALYKTHREHGDGPLLEDLPRAASFLYGKLRRVTGRAKTVYGSANVQLGGLKATARGRVTPGDLRSLPLDQQVLELERRIRLVDSQREQDWKGLRTRFDEAKSELAGLELADELLKDLVKDAVAGTVKLQLWGLLLVALGTATMAIPVLTE